MKGYKPVESNPSFQGNVLDSTALETQTIEEEEITHNDNFDGIDVDSIELKYHMDLQNSAQQHFFPEEYRTAYKLVKDYIMSDSLIPTILRLVGVIIFWIVLAAYSFKFWKAGLKSCEGDIIQCLIKMSRVLSMIGSSILVFSIMIIAIPVSGLILAKNPILKISSVLIFIYVFVYLFKTCKGFSWSDHSQGNFIICEIFWLVEIILSAFGYATYRFWKNENRNYFRIWSTFWGIVFIYLYFTRFYNSCKDFNKPLVKGYGINHDWKNCEWQKAGICWHFAISGLFKPMYWFRGDCAFEKNDASLYLARLKGSKHRILGLPNIKSLSLDTIIHYEDLQDKIIKGGVPVSEEEMENGDIEVFYDFRKGDDKGEVIIKVRDLTKKKEYKDKFLPHDRDHLNILQIFVDTVSRQHFHRRFKKSIKFLKKYHYSKNMKYRAYEFFRYHSIRGYTSPNMIGSVYGDYDDAYDQNEKRIEHFASEKGYVTGVTNEMCNGIEVMRKRGYKAKFVDLQYYPDHALYQTSCDPNVLPLQNGLGFGLSRGPFTVHLNCLFNKDLISFNVEYTKQFFDTYKDKRKYFTIKMIDNHEFSQEQAELIEDPYVANLLEHLEKNGHLENTIVEFWSDHGDHIDPIAFQTQSGVIERYNPFLFVIIPEDQREKIGNHIENNTQRFTLAYDIFISNLNYLGFNRTYKFGNNFLTEELDDGRSCQSTYLWNADNECRCLMD